MFYFMTRKFARAFLSTNKDKSDNVSHWKIVDCKDKPSIKGYRWAVKVLKTA